MVYCKLKYVTDKAFVPVFTLSYTKNKNEHKLNWNNFGASLKSDSHFPKKLFHLLHWKPFKMMKNAFYFILKAWRYLSFCHDFLAM